MKTLLKNVYRKIFPPWSVYLKRELSDCITALDLGCGNDSLLQNCSVPFSVGVELFEPYLHESNKKRIHSQYIKADIRRIEFRPKSFDAVIVIEVLEHLTKEEGTELLGKIEQWARKKIIITTPNGYLWQDDYDDNPLQKHKSAWSVKEFNELGYTIRGIRGWKKLRGYRTQIKYKPAFIFIIISDITHIITYWLPHFAFQFFAVKDVEEK